MSLVVAAREECLSEETLARLVEGRLSGDELSSAEQHLSRCETCVTLVAGAADLLEGAAIAGHGQERARPRVLSSGDRVGRYVIVEMVGAGAMGRVYAAHDPALDRKIALKLLHAHAATPELETRLLREAKAMAKLTHPEVITVYDAGRQDSQLYIAMEFVEGGTLRQWLAREKRSWREVVAVFARAGRGLARAHAAGIVHRDFKPDNVLIGGDGRVRVTDFGLARNTLDVEAGVSPDPAELAGIDAALSRSLTRTGMLVGTPAYMAPEQLAGAPADVCSDVYSFCVALYEGLYGERPFAGGSLAALQREKLEGRVRKPPAGADVPLRLRRVLLAVLRQRAPDQSTPTPDGRPRSMDELLVALERATKAPRLPLLGIGGVIALAAVFVAWGARSHKPSVSLPASSAPLVSPSRACTARSCVDALGGAPAVCRPSDGACVPVASPDCTPKLDPQYPNDEGTVWIGAMFPTKGPNAEAFGLMNAEGADFAREEIAHATRGLSGAGASLPVRRIALVLCDDSVDPMRAARHLVDDVGVPAILGFGSGKEIEEVAGPLLIQRHVVTMASLTSSPLITRIPQPADLPRMVWRTTYSIEAVADATAAFLRDTLETRASSEAAGDRRVTLARIDNGLGGWFGEAFYRRLSFNGKSAIDNGDKYQELIFAPDPSDDDVRAYAERVARSNPTFLVLLGPSSETSRIVAAVEAHGRRPTYVIASDTTGIVDSFIGRSEDRRRRVFSVVSVTGMSEARFVIRFNATHTRKVTRTLNPGMSYDAFYVLAYASFALGGESISGPSLARAIERLLPPGRRVETGETDLFEGLSALSRGEHVDLAGPSGSLDFDPRSGEASSDFGLFCPARDALGNAVGDEESGVVFRAGAQHAEGTFACP